MNTAVVSAFGERRMPHLYYEPSSCIYPGSVRISSTTSFCCQCVLYFWLSQAITKQVCPADLSIWYGLWTLNRKALNVASFLMIKTWSVSGKKIGDWAIVSGCSSSTTSYRNRYWYWDGKEANCTVQSSPTSSEMCSKITTHTHNAHQIDQTGCSQGLCCGTVPDPGGTTSLCC